MARALLVDAVDESARSFYLKHGFLASPISPMQLCLRLDVARVSAAVAEAQRRGRAGR